MAINSPQSESDIGYTSIQNGSSQRHSSQPISWLSTEKN